MRKVKTKIAMVVNLSENHSLLTNWVSELRDVNVQNDRMRFRRNLERIAEVIAYEISKELLTKTIPVQTPMGIADCKVLENQPIIATILRAGLPMHQGLLNYYDKADNAFISAYRKHNNDGSFEISLDYVSCADFDSKDLLVCDPMLATGSSLIKTIQYLQQEGNPSSIHIICAIACTVGIENVKRAIPSAKIWCASIDDELTAKGYIVPGLGDAGDLAYGPKMQN